MIDSRRLLALAPAWGVPLVVATALVVGAFSGLASALLTLASGALLGAVTLLWSSLGRLTGESPLTLEEAVGLGAPSPEEERKRSILRALKDLEYERSVGKISEEDFAELSVRYRAEAKELLRALEEELAPRRRDAEARLALRLKKDASGSGGKKKSRRSKEGAKTRAERKRANASATAEDSIDGKAGAEIAGSETTDIDADVPPEAAPSDAAKTTCPSCDTPNDADARFCKRCGTTLGAPATEAK